MVHVERQRVGVGLSLVVVVRARQISPALISSDLDKASPKLWFAVLGNSDSNEREAGPGSGQ